MYGRPDTIFPNAKLEYGVDQSTPWEFAFHAVKTDRFECIGYEFI